MLSRLGLGFLLAICVLGPSGCGPTDDSPRDGGPADARPQLPDEDGDTISDQDEGRALGVDTDGDGTPDYLDSDSDGDGIPDVREAGDADNNTPPRDSDNDGTPDFRDDDSDDNGVPDRIEGANDTDGDMIGDFADTDNDGDGLLDVAELNPDPTSPRDTDGDGTPDYMDTDSDGDTILDSDDLLYDPDQDGIPAYRDLDSDGDGIPDAIEAGDADPATKPVDTDADTIPDFLDVDSDADGLLDSAEDPNGNGLVDPGESDPRKEDTDGDGVSDLIEAAAGTDPQDAGSNPQSQGDFVFIVPYNEPPTPADDTLDFSTNIAKADVVFALDTTGSMSQETANLKSALSNTIVPGLKSQIPNVGVGVTGYADFPTSPYGSAGDLPFYLKHRVMTVSTAAGLSSVQAAVNSYPGNYGADGPESGWFAMHEIATGQAVNMGGASIPAFNPATAPPNPVIAGESVGTIGGVGFRSGALPIVVMISDAYNHNSEGFPGNEYTFGGPMRSQSVNELKAIGARLIGVASQGGLAGVDADMLYGATQTGAVVPPTAWDAARPAGCGAGQCCTGLNGAGKAPDGTGNCPLVFTVDANGSGLGNSIVTAIGVLTTYSVIDIGRRVEDDAADAVDAVAAFVERVQANNTAGAPCAPGLQVADRDSDTVNDTFVDVNPGKTVCFDVVPKMNTTVQPTGEPQMFKATITVVGDNVTDLDTREIFFLVPPVIVQPPVD